MKNDCSCGVDRTCDVAGGSGEGGEAQAVRQGGGLLSAETEGILRQHVHGIELQLSRIANHLDAQVTDGRLIDIAAHLASIADSLENITAPQRALMKAHQVALHRSNLDGHRRGFDTGVAAKAKQVAMIATEEDKLKEMPPGGILCGNCEKHAESALKGDELARFVPCCKCVDSFKEWSKQDPVPEYNREVSSSRPSGIQEFTGIDGLNV